MTRHHSRAWHNAHDEALAERARERELKARAMAPDAATEAAEHPAPEDDQGAIPGLLSVPDRRTARLEHRQHAIRTGSFND